MTQTKRRVETIPPPLVVSPKASSSASCILSEEEAISQACTLQVFADPTRLQILSILSRQEGCVCVRELANHFNLTQPTISHHLRILRETYVVDSRKRGLYAYYYLRREWLARAQQATAEIFASFVQEGEAQ